MAKNHVPTLYKEIRLDLEPSERGSTIAVTLPSTSSFLSRSQTKRTILSESHIDQDENSFARRNLASEASLYFRALDKYPRCFLWRLLDDRKVLEIRSVDATRDTKDKEKRDSNQEANLTLLLAFPASVRPFGVAIAELSDKDAIAIFAVTTSNELYTITLTKSFFSKLEASEQDVAEWCKISSPSSFSFRYPYRLSAVSATELWASLHDGGLLQLTRKSGEDGSAWRETFFAEGSWGSSFRGLIPWKGQSTVRFGGVDLASTSAAATGVSPDSKHLLTICLNHTLKAWNLSTGKVGLQVDLLGEDLKEVQKTGPYLIGPSQPQLMQIIEVPAPEIMEEYYVVTYSPKQHRFKFWGIRDADSSESGLRDISSDFRFVPPVDELMNTTVWNMEEFHFNATSGWRDAEIWIRARSGPTSKVFTTKFNLFADDKELEQRWLSGWTAVDSGPLTIGELKLNPTNPINQSPAQAMQLGTSLTDQWLSFLFYPGRFTVSSLETALCIFRSGLNQAFLSNSKATLRERTCTAVASTVTFRQDDGNHTDYEQYEFDISTQWQTFYGIVQDLHKRRGESVSLSFDREEGSPWLILADYVVPVRRSSDLEILSDNRHILDGEEDRIPIGLHTILRDDASYDISRLLNAARTFRQRLSAPFRPLLKTAIDREIFQEPWTSAQTRLEVFETMCDLSSHATEEDMIELDNEIGFLYADPDLPESSFVHELFNRALSLFSEKEHGVFLTREVNNTGMRVLSRVSQEILDVHLDVLQDLLVLVAHIAMYAADGPPAGFDANSLFVTIVHQIRVHLFLKWLASTTLPGPPSITNTKSEGSHSRPSATTLLWLAMGRDAFNIHIPQENQPEYLTYWARAWAFAPFTAGVLSFAEITEDLMVLLISLEQWNHASDFQKFLGDTYWATYLRGRLCLASGEYAIASKHFKIAASGLANEQLNPTAFDRRGLIPLNERDLLCAGAPNYYRHIMELFEQAGAYSFVADYAKLALQNPRLHPKHESGRSSRSVILSRLFTASLKTSCFENAYSALVRQTDVHLRKSNLTSLISRMISQNQSSALLRLPLATLSNEVDNVLESLCHKTLNIASGPPYHKILYAYRVSRNDFRGAASILYERLQRLQSSSSATEEALTQCYLVLINTLASVSPEQAWIFAEGKVEEDGIFGGGTARIGRTKDAKRRVVTLDDVRKEYERELDRQSALENGQFAFGDEDEDAMDLM